MKSTLIASALQTTSFAITLTCAIGLTTTESSKESPVHPKLDSGIIVYIKVAGSVVSLVKIWLINGWFVAAEPPVMAFNGMLTGSNQV